MPSNACCPSVQSMIDTNLSLFYYSSCVNVETRMCKHYNCMVLHDCFKTTKQEHRIVHNIQDYSTIVYMNR